VWSSLMVFDTLVFLVYVSVLRLLLLLFMRCFFFVSVPNVW